MTDLLRAADVDALDAIPEDRWYELAACRGIDPELFFAAKGDTNAIRRARAVCARCPVAAACVEEAVLSEPGWGVWGGTTVRDRQRIRRETGLTGRPRIRPPAGPRRERPA